MTYNDPIVTIGTLADGIVCLNDTTQEWSIVRQDHSMPQALRRGLALLSSICLEDGIDDLGCCIHNVLAMATKPIEQWGVPTLADPAFDYSGTILVDGDLGVPTEDCIALARIGGEVETLQNLQHNRLRASVAMLGSKRKSEAYSAIREFVVRNPVVSVSDLKSFVSEGGRAAVAKDIERFYEQIPIAAVWEDGTIRLCDGCGGLLWDDPDKSSYPEGRCHLRQCAEKYPTPRSRRVLTEPSAYCVVERSINAFWVGPGLDEVRIFDSLQEAGIDVVLYPREDAADVGTKDLRIGIDAKSYASPVVLGRKLSENIGGLAAFGDKYLVVPDVKIKKNPDYVKQLKDAYTGTDKGIKFTTVSDAIARILKMYRSGA